MNAMKSFPASNKLALGPWFAMVRPKKKKSSIRPKMRQQMRFRAAPVENFPLNWKEWHRFCQFIMVTSIRHLVGSMVENNKIVHGHENPTLLLTLFFLFYFSFFFLLFSSLSGTNLSNGRTWLGSWGKTFGFELHSWFKRSSGMQMSFWFSIFHFPIVFALVVRYFVFTSWLNGKPTNWRTRR